MSSLPRIQWSRSFLNVNESLSCIMERYEQRVKVNGREVHFTLKTSDNKTNIQINTDKLEITMDYVTEP